jgi:putative (di)nucleoside polyphosphate hydrolase
MSDVIDRDGFRANVGIMLMSGDGKLFIARRAGGRGWQFPQGGMRRGESDEESLFRELMEEIGVAAVTCVTTHSRYVWARSSAGSCCACGGRIPASGST